MRVYSFSECLAHQNDPLCCHLLAVARGVHRLWESDRGPHAQAARLAALVHDVGKANAWFQERIHKGGGEKNVLSRHSAISAAIGWLLSKFLPEEDLDAKCRLRLSVLVSILKHHGDLRKPWIEVYQNVRAELRQDQGLGEVLAPQISTMDLFGFREWLRDAQTQFGLDFEVPELSETTIRQAFQEVSAFALRNPFPADENRADDEAVSNALGFLFGFGSLLQMDKIHSATGQEEFRRVDLIPKIAASYLSHVKSTRPSSPLDPIREEIRETTTRTLMAHREERFFTLTAPTGSGKTLTALHAALQLRQAIQQDTGEAPRILYCLPFTAIIEQNYDVYRQAFQNSGYADTSDVLLKHHHLTDMKYRSSDPEFDEDASELFVETWQSELVVTTFHQLLYTLFTGRNRNLKRLPTLRNAIVILDEVQALPCKYWSPIRRMFQQLGEMIGTRFVLMTATRPLIFLREMSRELLPDHAKYFHALSRVRLLHRAQSNIPVSEFVVQLVEEIRNEPGLSRMVVVNWRRLVRELTERFEEQVEGMLPVHPLSGFLTPLDRRNRIQEISRRLGNGEPCLVVTTQLIEAGVDLSVDRVERDLAPLDSLIQAAGRCNRHAADRKGQVRVWSLTDEEGHRYTGIYGPVLIDVTREVLDEYGDVEETRFLDMSQTYFRRMYDRSRAAEEPVDRLLACGRFEEVESRFRLIDELPNQSCFVIQNEEDEAIWRRYLQIEEMKGLERKRAFFSIRSQLMERVIQVFNRDESSEDRFVPLYAAHGAYDARFGYVSGNSTGATFF